MLDHWKKQDEMDQDVERLDESILELTKKIITKQKLDEEIDTSLSILNDKLQKKMADDNKELYDKFKKLKYDQSQMLVIPGLVGPIKKDYPFQSFTEFMADFHKKVEDQFEDVEKRERDTEKTVKNRFDSNTEKLTKQILETRDKLKVQIDKKISEIHSF